MGIRTKSFFAKTVAPAIEDYFAAERELTAAFMSRDPVQLATARQLVLRRARTAAIELHQFADRVLADRPAWGPSVSTANEVRIWLKNNFCPSPNFFIDFEVLHTVADAFKHAELTKSKSKKLLFRKDDVVVTVATGWGQMRFNEGKWGGAEQLVIKMGRSKMCAMSMVLRTVSRAWQTAMKRRKPRVRLAP